VSTVRTILALAAAASLAACAASAPPHHQTPVYRPDPQPVAVRPVATYSIIARDNTTGEMGAAVQSHWFSVGSVVPWARQGVGVVATQSLADVRYGPLGLELMASGRTAQEALGALTSSDTNAAVRQVAMIDGAGNVATHTGDRCIAEASGLSVHDDDFYTIACQANLMERTGVPEAMRDAFTRTPGDLSERLMAALEAAEAAGGDIRGKQSAAMIVVPGGPPTLTPWREKTIDIRVEDHRDPLGELRRLLIIARGYAAMNEGDLALERGDIDAALAAYARAEGQIRDNVEPAFWTGVSLANAGRIDDALPRFAKCFNADARWRETLRRLVPAGLLTVDQATLDRLLASK
jgi:uncharacterized Ntn-hydrolase superfamily protein